MKAKTFLKYLILLVVVSNLAVVAIVFLGSQSPKPTPMPNPNGYDDFVKAGRMVHGNVVRGKETYDYADLSKPDLRALVSSNSEALRLVRIGLTHESRAPEDYSPSYLSRGTYEYPSFKELAFAFCAEGRLAELERRTNGAVKIYLEGMRFGQECSRGGVMILKMVGIASESICQEHLLFLTNSLDAQSCREVVASLQALDSQEEPPEKNLEQEDEWQRKSAASLYEALESQAERIWHYKAMHNNRRRFVDDHCHISTLRRRQVMVLFAARAFQLEKGIPPKTLDDLVPAYLKTVPQDPLTGTNVVLGQPLKKWPPLNWDFHAF